MQLDHFASLVSSSTHHRLLLHLADCMPGEVFSAEELASSLLVRAQTLRPALTALRRAGVLLAERRKVANRGFGAGVSPYAYRLHPGVRGWLAQTEILLELLGRATHASAH